ncbi:hypothetical protein TcWFU_000712 [Taenia crassiceps]|uniref:Uncharacterized protein n=1 Tax=Taenia crassiceps TaxID=6207 RepID=A0ABR4QCL1_9CEST
MALISALRDKPGLCIFAATSCLHHYQVQQRFYGSCFNSVRRRQLRRSQKRIDWFFTPLPGLHNAGASTHPFSFPLSHLL